MNRSQLQNESEPLISESSKHPRVFAWKSGALILAGLIAIMVIVDIGMLIYLDSNPVPPTNLTFANDIVFETEIITQSSMIKTMMANMLKSNPGVSYQFSDLLFRGNGSQLTAQNLKQKVFRIRDHNLLFIFQAQSGADSHVFGLYSSAQFPVPSSQKFRSYRQYYTFQFGDDRKSMLFSLQNNNFLKANSTRPKSPKNCTSYTLWQSKNQFTLLNLLQVTLDEDSSVKIFENGTDVYQCYDKVSSMENLNTAIEATTGFDFTDNVTIQAFQVFYLQN